MLDPLPLAPLVVVEEHVVSLGGQDHEVVRPICEALPVVHHLARPERAAQQGLGQQLVQAAGPAALPDFPVGLGPAAVEAPAPFRGGHGGILGRRGPGGEAMSDRAGAALCAELLEGRVEGDDSARPWL